MSYHAVNLFCCVVALDGLTTFFVALGEGFSFIVLQLCGVVSGLFLGYFALFCIVPRAIQQACFPSRRPISWMACIFVLRLPAWPVLGLVGKADSPPFRFLPRLPLLVSALIGVLEVVPVTWYIFP